MRVLPDGRPPFALRVITYNSEYWNVGLACVTR